MFMKDVLVTTFSNTYNKGANLQMFALKESIESLGANVGFLNVKLREKHNIKGMIWKYVNSFFAFCFRKTIKLRYTKYYKSYDELLSSPPKADIYIVGSDQIWNNVLTLSTDSRIYYCCYLPDKARKFSYAASFGSNEWVKTPYDEEIFNSLQTFQRLSVRELDSIEIINNLIGNTDVRLDLDPTLLLSSSSLDKLCKQEKNHFSSNYIYCYMLYQDHNINELLDVLLKDNSKSVKGHSRRGILRVKDICTIRGWVKNIANSDLVITNSFHCLVFSILYHKNFIVLPSHPNREGRLLSLLNLIHQENRYVNNLSSIHPSLFNDIDYDVVEKFLSPYRESSMQYLKDILSE